MSVVLQVQRFKKLVEEQQSSVTLLMCNTLWGEKPSVLSTATVTLKRRANKLLSNICDLISDAVAAGISFHWALGRFAGCAHLATPEISL